VYPKALPKLHNKISKYFKSISTLTIFTKLVSIFTNQQTFSFHSVGRPQDNKHDTIVEALSQLFLNNEQDIRHDQEVILDPFRTPRK